MNSFLKKLATGTAVVAITATVFASGTMAQDNDVTTEINGTESVTISDVSAASFASTVLLNGTTQTVTGASIGTFDVTDARGSGEGWDISVSATPFTHGINGKALSAGSLNLAAPSVSLKDDGSSPGKTVTAAGGAIDGNSITLLSAGTDGGMGSYTVSAMDMELKLLPKEVYEGTYTSTVTVSLIAGPQG